MRLVALLMLAGCGLDFEPMMIFGAGAGWECEPQAWTREVLYDSRSVTIVLATRGSCSGFPDAATDYRLERDGALVTEGTIETKHWIAPQAFRDVDGSVRIDLADERCRVTAATFVCAHE